jgi:DNA-binding NarL/FixJ family response regulator
MADLRVRQGRLEEAAALLDGLDQHPDAVRPLAALRLARGEHALARDGLERAVAEPELSWAVAAPLLVLLVDVHLATGGVEEAAAVASRLADLAAGHPSPYLRACAALTQGRVCLASASAPGDARACLHEALAAFSQAQMPAELARTRLELARAVAAERPEVAVAEAAAALEAFEQLEATRDVDAAAALLRSLGGRARARPKGRRDAAGLTQREREVLELLGHGLSNPEIADRLFISAKTVEHHVGRVLAKLGLRNRAEAAAYAAKSGGA